MIQSGTLVKVCDKTGVVLGICIKVLGHARRRIAILGDVIVIAIQRIILKNFKKLNYFVERNFLKVLCIGL